MREEVRRDFTRLRGPGLLVVTALVLFGMAIAWSEDDKDYPHGEFMDECTLCHSDDAWIPVHPSADFHHGDSGFVLEGAHAGVYCTRCHSDLDFAKAESSCVSCHQDVHRSELGIDCGRCHSTTTFLRRADELRAHRMTRFPLTGAHAVLDCESCHPRSPASAPVYVGTTTDCAACHLAAYRATSAPDHVASGFSVDCQSCHSAVAWEGARFDHAKTAFPLSGPHKNLDCADCHAKGVGGATGKVDCIACHRDDFNRTTSPNHRQLGFPEQCMSCHVGSDWHSAGFDHARSDFPLTGGHVALGCAECHFDGVYDGKATDCYSCHKTAYDGTKDPHHRVAGFGTDCSACHTSSGWAGASFDHTGTAFPLTGAHTGLACASCHADGIYDGKATDCFSCHKTNYDNTTEPNHRAAGFPTDCGTCHDTRRWEGAEFDHDGRYFPIYSGKHKNKWDRCSDCHLNPDNYSVFSCIDCHKHADKNKVDRDHREVTGYRYASSACFQCHPDGRED